MPEVLGVGYWVLGYPASLSRANHAKSQRRKDWLRATELRCCLCEPWRPLRLCEGFRCFGEPAK